MLSRLWLNSHENSLSLFLNKESLEILIIDTLKSFFYKINLLSALNVKYANLI